MNWYFPLALGLFAAGYTCNAVSRQIDRDSGPFRISSYLMFMLSSFYWFAGLVAFVVAAKSLGRLT